MQDFDAILFGELGEDFLAEVFVFLGPTYVAKFFKAGTFFVATSQASAKVVKGVSQICLLCPKFIRSSSEVHPKFIRSSSEVHPKFIRSSSEVHPKFMRPWEHSTVKSSACWARPGLAECTNRWGRMTRWVATICHELPWYL